uniref:Uncharacterized protein n=1 Tax=Anopheles melas TaxID=34690 RepID=A0A182TSC3_9DIPT
MFKDLREADWLNFVCGFFLSFAAKRRLEVGTNKKKERYLTELCITSPPSKASWKDSRTVRVKVVAIASPAAASTATAAPGTGASAPGHVPSFCNILNASNSSDLQAVAYNSLTQNVRCKSPPTLVDNLKNGTIG